MWMKWRSEEMVRTEINWRALLRAASCCTCLMMAVLGSEDERSRELPMESMTEVVSESESESEVLNEGRS